MKRAARMDDDRRLRHRPRGGGGARRRRAAAREPRHRSRAAARGGRGHPRGAGGPGLELVAAVHRRPRAARRRSPSTSPRATGSATTRRREIVVTCGGTEGVLDVLLATLDPGDEVVLTDPIYAGLVNRVRLAGGVPVFAPLAVVDGEWRLDRDALAAAVTDRDRRAADDEPVDAVRAACSTRDGLGGRRRAVRQRTTCSCSTTRRWRRCCSTAARRSGRSTSRAWPSAR